ncbi:MAG: hypothetical protein ACE5JJ_03070 [Nitrospinota bacterium]
MAEELYPKFSREGYERRYRPVREATGARGLDALVEAALARWEEEGVAKAITFISRGNRPSWALFESLGFAPERVRRFPYCLEYLCPWGKHLTLTLQSPARVRARLLPR